MTLKRFFGGTTAGQKPFMNFKYERVGYMDGTGYASH
jgi:hypothetical protein